LIAIRRLQKISAVHLQTGDVEKMSGSGEKLAVPSYEMVHRAVGRVLNVEQ
jgi:hypothetical protein